MKKILAKWWCDIASHFKADNISPRYLAMSMAVGIGIGLMPIWGQAYFCFLLWATFKKFKKLRFNLVLACACTFISNPLTTPFMAFGYYLLGCLIMGKSGLSFESFITQAKDILESTSTFTIKLKDGFDFALGDVGLPIAIGYAISALICAPLAYVLSYKIALFYKNRRLEKKRAAELESKGSSAEKK